ncbi:MAG: VOC family protein [Cyanobacteria bacterium J06632_22]
MKNLWSGIITEQVQASKAFYVQHFSCEVLFESDWFVLLQLGGGELGFMLPNLDAQAGIFRTAFNGSGLWITIDVENVEAQFERLQQSNVDIVEPLKREAWGDYHFVVRDPNGIGVDVVERPAGA